MFLIPLIAGAVLSPSWTQITDQAAFSPRDTAEGVVFQDKLWLSNGYYHGNVLTRDLWTSADGATWTQVRDDTPYDGYSEMAVYRDKLWAVKSSVWSSTDGVAWERVAEITPFGTRGYGELVVHDGRMWQLGSGADVWHTTNAVEWTQATAHAPYGDRAATAVVVFKDHLWLLAGRTEKPNTPAEKQYPQYTTHNDVWRSRDGVSWERMLDHAPWSPRMWCGVAAFAGRLWIMGGFDNASGANLGDVWCSEDGTTWRQFEAEPTFSPRHEPTCYVFENSLWVVAGNAWPVQNDVWRLRRDDLAIKQEG